MAEISKADLVANHVHFIESDGWPATSEVSLYFEADRELLEHDCFGQQKIPDKTTKATICLEFIVGYEEEIDATISPTIINENGEESDVMGWSWSAPFSDEAISYLMSL